MASFYVQKELDQEKANMLIQEKLKDAVIEDFEVDKKGKLCIFSKWIEYKISVEPSQTKTKIKINTKWNKNKKVMIFFFGIFISLFVFTPKKVKAEQKVLTDKIFELLSN